MKPERPLFRTLAELPDADTLIKPDTKLTLLGSCFSDNVGTLLERDGFDTVHNPFGALYNPMTVASLLHKTLTGYTYTSADLTNGPRGYHCLDFSTAFSGPDAEDLLNRINKCLEALRLRLCDRNRQLLVITFGTAFTFVRTDNGIIAGNCHKFPATFFVRQRQSVEAIVRCWQMLLPLIPSEIEIVFTVSPIRHLADGMHGNQLSKATLLLATDTLCSHNGRTHYFPAYEIVLDELRDYRYYASDMRHPSDVAVDYIYKLFTATYFNPDAIRSAAEARSAAAAAAHRPILPSI